MKSALLTIISLLAALGLVEAGMRALGRGLLAEQETGNEIAPADARAVRIVAIGESTTADMFSREEGQAWPRQLEQLLRERGVPARVYNLGRPGATTSLILDRLSEQLERYRPRIVISMMGINDKLGLVLPRTSWLTELRLAKLWHWFRVRMRTPKQIESRNFGDPFVTVEILDSLRLPDPAAGLARADAVASGLKPGERAQYFLYLAEAYYGLVSMDHDPREDILLELTKRSLSAKFHLSELFRSLPDLLWRARKGEECLRLARRYESTGWWAEDVVLFHFSLCARDERNPEARAEWQRLLRSMSPSPSEDEPLDPFERTSRNYRRAHDILISSGITWIAMQYPTMDVEDLRSYFRAAPPREGLASQYHDIVFAENKRNFSEALAAFPYQDLFIDRFGGTFGHTTNLGHTLIAKTASEAVLKLLGR